MTINDIVDSDLEFIKLIIHHPIEPQIWGLNYPKECNIIKSKLTHYKYIIYTHYS